MPPEVARTKTGEPEGVPPTRTDEGAVIRYRTDEPVGTYPEISGDMLAKGKRRLRLPLLYMALGAALLVVLVGLILLIIKAC